jgi:DNA-binding response OmpR family regulator
MEKIMVIDPNIVELQKLNENLSKDHIVLACSRANKALELIQVFKPSVLLLEPSTPGLSTREFIRKARSYPQLGGLSVIAMTKITELRHIEESFEWGVDVIFSKPVPFDRLRKKLGEMLFKDRSFVEKEVSLAF